MHVVDGLSGLSILSFGPHIKTAILYSLLCSDSRFYLVGLTSSIALRASLPVSIVFQSCVL